MKRYILAPYICAGVASACVFAGFALNGQWYGALAAVMVAAIWFFNIRRHKAWLLHIVLALSIMNAVAGALVGANKVILLAAILLFLAAWDLALFQSQLDGKVKDGDIRPHRRHVKVLAGVLGIGALLSLAGMFLTIPLGFGWLFVLALVAAISLSRFSVHWQHRIKK